MSKFYLYSTTKKSRTADILEVSSSKELKSIVVQIKTTIPKASFGVIGAKDISTLKRTHRTFGPCKVIKSVDEFIQDIVSN